MDELLFTLIERGRVMEGIEEVTSIIGGTLNKILKRIFLTERMIKRRRTIRRIITNNHTVDTREAEVHAEAEIFASRS